MIVWWKEPGWKYCAPPPARTINLSRVWSPILSHAPRALETTCGGHWCTGGTNMNPCVTIWGRIPSATNHIALTRTRKNFTETWRLLVTAAAITYLVLCTVETKGWIQKTCVYILALPLSYRWARTSYFIWELLWELNGKRICKLWMCCKHWILLVLVHSV